jgi:hypothetical protein
MKKQITVKRRYKATNGAQFDKNRVQVYGKELERIERENGKLTPIDVINEARSISSPLHEVFDWDDNSAAEKFRLVQARGLINHITVEIKYDHTTKEQKAWFSVNTTPNNNEVDIAYVNVERVLTEKPLREQMLLEAIQEAEYWQEKYEQYRELNRIFSSIKATKKAIRAKYKVAKKKK